MFSRLREPFGKAGLIVAIVALVAATVGGAYAANSATDSAKRHHKKKKKKQPGLNAKQKKQVRSIAKTEARKVGGVTGPAGPQGPKGDKGDTGTKGDKGDTGDKGANGAPGADGKTVLNGEGVPAAALGNDGDFYIDTAESDIYGPKTAGNWGVPTSLQGAPGSPWTAGGTLPANATETGVVSFANFGTGFGTQTLDFTVPLAAALDGEHVHIYTDTEEDEGGAFGDTCTGSIATPTAPSGHLCVYGLTSGEVSFALEDPASFGRGASAAGAALGATFEGAGFNIVTGSWAVTG